jgi:hypothetical protein
MARSTVFDAYQDAYYKAATQMLFRNFQVVRPAASFVYNDVGSGGIGATSGEKEVSKYSNKELHYGVPILNSGTLTLSIEGRSEFYGTFTQLDQFTVTAAMATWMNVSMISEQIDKFRVGVKASSPAASDIFNAYLLLK